MKLTKRGNIWWVDYRANGRRHRQSTGTCDRKLAEAWMKQIDAARQMPTFESAVEVLRMFYGQRPKEGMIPIPGIYDAYSHVAKAVGKDKIAADTLRVRRNHIERLARWIAEKRPTVEYAEHISGPIAAAFAEFLARSGLKTKSRRNIIGDLSTVWTMLEKASAGISNPWKNLSPPDTDGRRGEAFSRAQEQSVLDAAKKIGKDWYPICLIMQNTGLRYGDVARLEWREIQGDVIRMAPNKTRRHGITVAIPLLAQVRDALAALPKVGNFVFPVHAELYGQRRARSAAGLRFREVLDAAGISGTGYSVHSWRHTAATRLAEAGADIETRKRILGHTEDITARRYDHDEHLAETRRALEAAASA